MTTRPRPSITTVLAAVVALVSGLVLAAGPAGAVSAPESPPPRLALPEPSGPHAVSTDVIGLRDPSRTDPWRPDTGARRLVVTMTYPTDRTGGPPARYMTPAESRAYLDFQADQGFELPTGLSRDVLASTRVPASVGRPAGGGRHSRPLVLLSPGFSLPRATLTAVATDLASHGYVVASVDHVGESTGVQLPGGRLVRCAACDVEDYGSVPPVRAADLSYVLDRLRPRSSPWPGARVIDRDRIAVVGHSIGGNAAATALTDDPRVDAGVDLDGTFFDPVARDVAKPFLMLGTRELHTPTGQDATWPRDWKRFTGSRHWLTVRGSNHGSFTDLPLLGDQAGIAAPSGLSGRRSLLLTRTAVRAFLDTTLRDRPERPILRGADPRWPEVVAHDPS